MACVHLQQLIQLCEDQELRLSSSDLIRMVCTQCGEQEVCPSMLTDEYDARHPESRQPESDALRHAD
jgi:hypothetical protein